jgi:hypothetical protein
MFFFQKKKILFFWKTKKNIVSFFQKKKRKNRRPPSWLASRKINPWEPFSFYLCGPVAVFHWFHPLLFSTCSPSRVIPTLFRRGN